MDGDFAPLDKIAELADKYKALIFVDECHATGFIGRTGRGTPEYFGVEDRIDIINSTLGKALGGATGGYTTGRADVVELLRQKGRPYLFSNTLAPAVCGGAMKSLEIASRDTKLRDLLAANTTHFRKEMKKVSLLYSFHQLQLALFLIHA